MCLTKFWKISLLLNINSHISYGRKLNKTNTAFENNPDKVSLIYSLSTNLNSISRYDLSELKNTEIIGIGSHSKISALA